MSDKPEWFRQRVMTGAGQQLDDHALDYGLSPRKDG
jgi:hypothetical protein